MSRWKVVKSLLEWAEHVTFINHIFEWLLKYFGMKELLFPLALSLFSSIAAAVKGWDSLWIAIAALATFAVALMIVAAILFLINPIRASRGATHESSFEKTSFATPVYLTPYEAIHYLADDSQWGAAKKGEISPEGLKTHVLLTAPLNLGIERRKEE